MIELRPLTTNATTTVTTTTVPDVLPELVLDDTGVPVNGQTRGVLLTDTGWITPILSATETGHRVWTPCARQADISGGRVITDADFVLDPGHGGSEPGAVGRGGLVEKDLNLAVSLKVRDALVGAGYSVVMTRERDGRVPIVTRSEIARALNPIAFISVHFNAGTDAPSAIPGTEIYHQIESADSKRFAGLLYEEVRAVLDPYDLSWVALNGGGAMTRPNEEGTDFYGVLRRSGSVLSVLTEFAYLSNPAEEALIGTPTVQDQFAAAVLAAIERYLSTTDLGSGFGENPNLGGYGSSGGGGASDCTDPPLDSGETTVPSEG